MLLTCLLTAVGPCRLLAADEVHATEMHLNSFTELKPFSGQVIGKKVRLRLTPDLDGHVIKELTKGEIFAVEGEQNGYYAVRPPKNSKAYIFRTFVIQDTVEGDRVNVRLYPDMDAPIVTQVNSGQKIPNALVADNTKWLEIDVPRDVYFWISKDYLEEIGPADLLQKIDNRKVEVRDKLKTAYFSSQAEMKKPFKEINLELAKEGFTKIINEYADLQDEVQKASDYLKILEKLYAEKNIAYLEEKALLAAKELENIKASPTETLIEESKVDNIIDSHTYSIPAPLKAVAGTALENWLPIEQDYYNAWLVENPLASMHDFYLDQEKNSQVLTGTVEPFSHFVKNKPGDYIIRSSNNMPIGYIYSTHVNLQEYLGKTISMKVVVRDSHAFAFPAYYVLSLD